LRASGWDVDELALAGDRAAMRVALAAAASHRREIARADVLHVELGCLDLAPYWFAILVSRRRPLVVVAHDVPRIALAPGTGLIGMGSRLRDVVGHRILSPALDGVLAKRFARMTDVAVVLSEPARMSWKQHAPARIVVADLAADPPTLERCSPSQGGYALFAGYVGPGKGIDTLLEAWGRIATRCPLPLVIAGTNTGGIGDISYAQGGRMPPHASHRRGRSDRCGKAPLRRGYGRPARATTMSQAGSGWPSWAACWTARHSSAVTGTTTRLATAMMLSASRAAISTMN